jgi:hypothetical protein
MHRFSLALVLLTASCSCSGSGPVAGGATPYVRCAMAEPSPVDRQLGPLHLRSEERVLTIEGATSPVRIAVFRGPALADESFVPALDAIEATRPDLALLLGSISDDGRGEYVVASLAELSIPTLVVLGGRDRPDEVARAIAAIPETTSGLVLDVSAFRAVRIAGVELVPVAGAPNGRYAQDDRACGLGPPDVDAIVSELGDATLPRFLIGFAAPSPLPGLEGGDAGSVLVLDLATRLSAPGGLFAWPDVPTPLPAAPSPTARLVVPAIIGLDTPLSDGARRPTGSLLVEVSPAGLAVPQAVPAAP